MVIRRNKQKGTAGTRAAEVRYRQLQAFLDDARTFEGVAAADVPGLRLRANEGERVYLCIRGVLLFETPLDLTEPEGARLSRAPDPVDRGELALTGTRAVFTGAKQIRQWAWANIIGITHSDRGPWTALDVSSRRRQFGLLYDNGNREQIRFSIDLASATALASRDQLIARLSEEIEEFARTVPDAPEAGTPSDADERDARQDGERLP
jgi:hypothetical protein